METEVNGSASAPDPRRREVERLRTIRMAPIVEKTGVWYEKKRMALSGEAMRPWVGEGVFALLTTPALSLLPTLALGTTLTLRSALHTFLALFLPLFVLIGG